VARQPLSPDPARGLPGVFLRTPTHRPLVYRKRIARVDAGVRPGDWVAVYAEPDTLLGYGVYNPRSEISVRILRFGAKLPDDAFWDRTLETAVGLRRDLLKLDDATDAYRLVHAEADGVSGIVIDRFGDVLSAEVFSLALWQRAEELLERCASLLGTRHTIIQPAPQILSQEGFDPAPKISEGAPREVTIREFGTRFRVRFEEGHKTGFFCDQRDNRRMLAEFCRGRSVLDLCCYTGGFAVQAMKLCGAAEATGVDLDEAPLRLARENADLNQVRVRLVQSDVFPFMRDMLRSGRQFDVIVLDPPKLIRSRAELEEGTRKHFDLNRLAMQLVRPGGILLSCTCAGLLGWDSFLQVLHSAARQAGEPLPGTEGETFPRRGPRPMQILAKTGAAMDHPIGASVPETEYLRAVWMRLG
jgi:23S rRNA (cytosine1962-C5)-methyltransferase